MRKNKNSDFKSNDIKNKTNTDENYRIIQPSKFSLSHQNYNMSQGRSSFSKNLRKFREVQEIFGMKKLLSFYSRKETIISESSMDSPKYILNHKILRKVAQEHSGAKAYKQKMRNIINKKPVA